MGEPLVSVVIPAYNCAKTIRQAVESVKIQDVDLEIIVVDDGSGDALAQVMEAYRDDPTVFYVKNERNIGAAASRNRAVCMARGKYVAFLDGDDWWEGGKLKKQLSLLEKTGYVLCSTARELVSPDGTPTGKVIHVREHITYRSLLAHNCINCSSVLVRTEAMREFPMEHEDAHEDYISWIRMLRRYRDACAVDEPLLKYRMSATGKSGGKLRSARMTYCSYRYAGLGRLEAALCFASYALHGVLKYGDSLLRVGHFLPSAGNSSPRGRNNSPRSPRGGR